MQAAGIPPAEKEGGENTTVHLGSFFKDGGAEIKQTRHRGRTQRLTLGFRVSFLRIAFCPPSLLLCAEKLVVGAPDRWWRRAALSMEDTPLAVRQDPPLD